MSNLAHGLEPFYAALRDLSVQTGDFEQRLSKERDDLRAKVGALASRITDLDLGKAGVSKESLRLFTGFRDRHSETVKRWLAYFDNQLQQEKLRSEFNQTFIVFIYGKVKAGKSSLGNFIANCARSDPAGLKPHFKEYDSNGSRTTDKFAELTDDDAAFDEKITECTREIQLFNLGGMTWIDTPGLSSLTQENEDLARRYIDAADFVIFPSSSDAPLQRPEIEQINELTGKFQRQITFVITKSDTSETDEVDGKIVEVLINKSPEDRKIQISDVRRRLQEGLDHPDAVIGEIMAISVAAAREALQREDKSLFDGSNLVAFCEMLRKSVLVKAAKLKKSAPYASLSGLIDAILQGRAQSADLHDPTTDLQKTGLNQIVADLNELSGTVKNLQTNYRRVCGQIDSRIPSLVAETVDECCRDLSASNSRQVFNHTASEITARINKLIEQQMRPVIEQFKNDYTSIAPATAQEEYSIETIYDEATRVTHYTKSGSTLGALLGGAVGFFVGGPAGAAVGAGLGMAGGGAIGSQIPDGETYQIAVGDNRLSVMEKFKQDTITSQRQVIKRMQVEQERNLIAPLEAIFTELNHAVEDLHAFLSERQKRYMEK